MEHPNIKVKVVHSKDSPAWKVVGTKLGGKYKIAIVPYGTSLDADVLDKQREEAKEHADFIAFCFNNPAIYKWK